MYNYYINSIYGERMFFMQFLNKASAIVLSVLLTSVNWISLCPCDAGAINTDTSQIFAEEKSASPDSQSVYNAIMAMESKYPEGTTWNNSNYYRFSPTRHI